MSNQEPNPQIFLSGFRERLSDDSIALRMADDVEALAQKYLKDYGMETLEELPEEAFIRMDEELSAKTWPRENNHE